MLVSTLSEVVIAGGIAGAVWAAAKRGSASVAQARASARGLWNCFMVLSPRFECVG
jgi:hypothetical protein